MSPDTLVPSLGDCSEGVPSPTCARYIAEDLLNRTGQALKTGDFALFATCFSIPTVIETYDGILNVETLEHCEQIFRDMRRYIVGKSVTDLIRHVVSCDFVAPDRILSTHEARMMLGAQLVQAPYPVLSTIDHTPDGWKITRSIYAIADAPEHVRVLTPKTAPTPPDATPEGDRT